MATPIPIWRDIYQAIGSQGDSFPMDFSVVNTDNNALVYFQGRALPRPGDTLPSVRINDIIAAQLVRGFAPAGETDTLAIRASILANHGEGVYPFFIYADWSYDRTFEPSQGMSAPVKGTFAPNQLLPVSAVTEDTGVQYIRFTLEGGGVSSTTTKVFRGGSGTIWLDVAEEWAEAEGTGDPETITVQDPHGVLRTYALNDGCRRWVLYYVNAFGGWDWLVVDGETSQADAVKRYTYDRVYNNAESQRGRVDYLNELTEQYTFNTGMLTDGESSRMHHLLNSPCVWAHDLQADVYLPLVLTGTETRRKRQGLQSYEITAAVAQDRLRR